MEIVHFDATLAGAAAIQRGAVWTEHLHLHKGRARDTDPVDRDGVIRRHAELELVDGPRVQVGGEAAATRDRHLCGRGRADGCGEERAEPGDECAKQTCSTEWGAGCRCWAHIESAGGPKPATGPTHSNARPSIHPALPSGSSMRYHSPSRLRIWTGVPRRSVASTGVLVAGSLRTDASGALTRSL